MFMSIYKIYILLNTLRTGYLYPSSYVTMVQDGLFESKFLTRTIYLITQYMEPVSEWYCWQMFIGTWPHSELIVCEFVMNF
jgi:hypothetical protein